MGDLVTQLASMSGAPVSIVLIDPAIGGASHDLSNESVGVVPPRLFTTDYATLTTAWVSTATCCELVFMAEAESFANAYDTYESPFGDGGIIPMPAGAATHGGDSPSFSQIMKLNSTER